FDVLAGIEPGCRPPSTARSPASVCDSPDASPAGQHGEWRVHSDDRPIIEAILPDKPVPDRNVEFRTTRADTGEPCWLARRGEYVRDLTNATGPRATGRF